MNPKKIKFVPYSAQYLSDCTELFDANCPKFFAANERDDYRRFLLETSEHYFLGFQHNIIAAAFGLTPLKSSARGRLHWIMLAPEFHGQGLGKAIMAKLRELAAHHQIIEIDIAASHLSAGFFSRFGAQEIGRTPHGWGNNMHRVDMVLKL